jgi:tetratricopeptide (TPR) repeat protein
MALDRPGGCGTHKLTMTSSETDSPAGDEESPVFGKVAKLLRQQRKGSPSEETLRLLKAAQKELKLYHQSHPESVSALRLLAECSQRFGELEKARDYISKAEILDPWNLEILIISESIYQVEASRGETDGSSSRLSSGLDSLAINPEELMGRAKGAFQLGELERSFSLAKLAYLLAPEAGHFLLDIWGIGSMLDPKRTYQELIQLQLLGHASPYLWLVIGSTCNVLGAYEEASGWITKGLEKAAEDPYALGMLHNELAYVMAKRGHSLDRCIAIARIALEVFPNEKANGFIRDTLGVAYLKKGDIDKAIQNLREAVSKDPTVIPKFHLALALLHQKDVAGALLELKGIAAARPSLETPHLEETAILERVQTHMGRLEDLLNLGGPDDVREALNILGGFI